MESEYGSKKGKSVFYASKNAGKIKGVEDKKSDMARRMGHVKNMENARSSMGRKTTSEILDKHK